MHALLPWLNTAGTSVATTLRRVIDTFIRPLFQSFVDITNTPLIILFHDPMKNVARWDANTLPHEPMQYKAWMKHYRTIFGKGTGTRALVCSQHTADQLVPLFKEMEINQVSTLDDTFPQALSDQKVSRTRIFKDTDGRTHFTRIHYSAWQKILAFIATTAMFGTSVKLPLPKYYTDMKLLTPLLDATSDAALRIVILFRFGRKGFNRVHAAVVSLLQEACAAADGGGGGAAASGASGASAAADGGGAGAAAAALEVRINALALFITGLYSAQYISNYHLHFSAFKAQGIPALVQKLAAVGLDASHILPEDAAQTYLDPRGPECNSGFTVHAMLTEVLQPEEMGQLSEEQLKPIISRLVEQYHAAGNKAKHAAKCYAFHRDAFTTQQIPETIRALAKAGFKKMQAGDAAAKVYNDVRGPDYSSSLPVLGTLLVIWTKELDSWKDGKSTSPVMSTRIAVDAINRVDDHYLAGSTQLTLAEGEAIATLLASWYHRSGIQRAGSSSRVEVFAVHCTDKESTLYAFASFAEAERLLGLSGVTSYFCQQHLLIGGYVLFRSRPTEGTVQARKHLVMQSNYDRGGLFEYCGTNLQDPDASFVFKTKADIEAHFDRAPDTIYRWLRKGKGPGYSWSKQLQQNDLDPEISARLHRHATYYAAADQEDEQEDYASGASGSSSSDGNGGGAAAAEA